MAALPSCSCCAYATTKEHVRIRLSEYESIVSKFKAAERQMEKYHVQINAIQRDVARKILTAAKSPPLNKDMEEHLMDLEAEYKDMQEDLGCPCCRAGRGAQVAAVEMMAAADTLRFDALLCTRCL